MPLSAMARRCRQRTIGGSALENAVYLALRTRGNEVSHAGERGSWDCDFVTRSQAIQVCLRLDPGNRQRELRGAAAVARLPGRRRALVLTLDQSDQLVEDGVAIEVMPAWRWLLEPAA
jgi:uncharacterized protein